MTSAPRCGASEFVPDVGGRSCNFGAKGLSQTSANLRTDCDRNEIVRQMAQTGKTIDLAYDAFQTLRGEVATPRLTEKWSETPIPETGWTRFRDIYPLRTRAKGTVYIRNATPRRTAGDWNMVIIICGEFAETATQASAIDINRGMALRVACSAGPTAILPQGTRRQKRSIHQCRFQAHPCFET